MLRLVWVLLLGAAVAAAALSWSARRTPLDGDGIGQRASVTAAEPANARGRPAQIDMPGPQPRPSPPELAARHQAANPALTAFVAPDPNLPLAEQLAIAAAHAELGDADAAHYLARLARRCLALGATERMLSQLQPSEHTHRQRAQCQTLGPDWQNGEALRVWMERAVALNHPVAVVEFLNQVPEMLGGADGVLANLDRAIELRERGRMYLERAAAEGNPLAWQTLAWMLAQDSILGPADPIRALAFQLALERHPDGAAQDPIYRSTLMAGLSPSDQARADALAEQMLRRCCPGR